MSVTTDGFLDGLTSITGIKSKHVEPTSNGLDVPKVVDDELSQLGYPSATRLSVLGNLGRENAWNVSTIFRGHDDPKNGARNQGLFSWQGGRRNQLNRFISQNGGDWSPNEKNLRLQARFLDQELKSQYPHVYRAVTDPNVDTAKASKALRQYIQYVPTAPYNTPDADYDVVNNRIWAEKAKARGLGGSGDLGGQAFLTGLKEIGEYSAPSADDFVSGLSALTTTTPAPLPQFPTALTKPTVAPDTAEPPVPSLAVDRPDVVPESSDTLMAQIAAAADPNVKVRAAVLTTSPEQNALFGNRSDFVMVPTKTGNLWVNKAKAKKLKLKSVEDIAQFVERNPVAIQRLTGTAENVGDKTDTGATVLTTAPDGTELSAKIVTTPEGAKAQVAADKQSFPGSKSKLVPAEKVAQKRIAKAPTEQPSQQEFERQIIKAPKWTVNANPDLTDSGVQAALAAQAADPNSKLIETEAEHLRNIRNAPPVAIKDAKGLNQQGGALQGAFGTIPVDISDMPTSKEMFRRAIKDVAAHYGKSLAQVDAFIEQRAGKYFQTGDYTPDELKTIRKAGHKNVNVNVDNATVNDFLKSTGEQTEREAGDMLSSGSAIAPSLATDIGMKNAQYRTEYEQPTLRAQETPEESARALADLVGERPSEILASFASYTGDKAGDIAALTRVISYLNPAKQESMYENLPPEQRPGAWQDDLYKSLQQFGIDANKLQNATGIKALNYDENGHPIWTDTAGTKTIKFLSKLVPQLLELYTSTGALKGTRALTELADLSPTAANIATNATVFGAQGGLGAAGQGATPSEVLRQTLKTGAIGGVFGAAGAAAEGATDLTGTLLNTSIPKIFTIGAKLGTIGGGTYGIARLAGDPSAQAAQEALVNVLFDVAPHVMGKIVEVGGTGLAKIKLKVSDTGDVSVADPDASAETAVEIPERGPAKVVATKILEPVTDATADDVRKKVAPPIIPKPLAPVTTFTPTHTDPQGRPVQVSGNEVTWDDGDKALVGDAPLAHEFKPIKAPITDKTETSENNAPATAEKAAVETNAVAPESQKAAQSKTQTPLSRASETQDVIATPEASPDTVKTTLAQQRATLKRLTKAQQFDADHTEVQQSIQDAADKLKPGETTYIAPQRSGSNGRLIITTGMPEKAGLESVKGKLNSFQKPEVTPTSVREPAETVVKLIDLRPGDRVKNEFGYKGTVFEDKQGNLKVERVTGQIHPLTDTWKLAGKRPLESNGFKAGDVVQKKNQIGKVYERGGQLRVKWTIDGKVKSEPLSEKWARTANPEAGSVDPSLLTLGLDRTIKDDVAPALKTAVKGLIDARDDIKKLIFAGSRGEAAKLSATSLRAETGKMARSALVAETALKSARKYFAKNPLEDNYDLISHIEEGNLSALPPAEQMAAKQLRDLLDDSRNRVQALGTGKLENYIENYFPHIWEDPKKAGNFFSGLVKRPFEGSKSFLKKRTYNTFQEGLDAGLKPVSDNPVDLTLLKIRDMDKYVAAHKTLQYLKDKGLAVFVREGTPTPEGFAKIDDRISSVYAPPTMQASEYVDAAVYEGLSKVAENLGITHERLANAGRGRIGYSEQGRDRIVTQFATGERVIAHEVSHQLDHKYGLQSLFFENANPHLRKTLKEELRALADSKQATFENPEGHRTNYTRKRPEQMAHILEAYVNNPEALERIAPSVKKVFESVIDAHPELAPLKDIRRSLGKQRLDTELSRGGPIKMGEYYAAEPAANIINNYLSPGLTGSKYGAIRETYKAWRWMGNVLNQAQLGLSGFHAMFTTLDAVTSKLALGVNQIAGGRPLEGLKSIAETPVSPVTNFLRGNKLMKEGLVPGSTDENTRILADLVAESGGRFKMDDFYRTKAAQKMADAFKRGNILGGVVRSPFAALDVASRPLMEYLVPRQKLGVFADMAKDTLARLGPDATIEQRREALQKDWDSVDNRMGQLVYDNLFWNKTIKDLSMASVRSVGWNLGDIRELGGAAKDLLYLPARVRRAYREGKQVEPVITRRMAYAVALPIVAGTIGAVTQYLFTGKGPDELKDYFFPKTGNVDENGNPERLSLPTYMKDVYAYSRHPGKTLSHKVHPLIGMISDMLQNRDYYGTEIRHADDPLVDQLGDVAKYIGKNVTPFSIQGALKEKDRQGDTKSKILPFFGFTPAPKDIDSTKAEDLADEWYASQKSDEPKTKAAAARNKEIGDLVRLKKRGENQAFQTEYLQAVKAGVISPADLKQVNVRMKHTFFQYIFSRMSIDDAVGVYEAATPGERDTLQKAMLTKVRNASNKGRVIPNIAKRLQDLGFSVRKGASEPNDELDN